MVSWPESCLLLWGVFMQIEITKDLPQQGHALATHDGSCSAGCKLSGASITQSSCYFLSPFWNQPSNYEVWKKVFWLLITFLTLALFLVITPVLAEMEVYKAIQGERQKVLMYMHSAQLLNPQSHRRSNLMT